MLWCLSWAHLKLTGLYTSSCCVRGGIDPYDESADVVLVCVCVYCARSGQRGSVRAVACSQYDCVVIYPELASGHLKPVGMASRCWRARWPFKCHRDRARASTVAKQPCKLLELESVCVCVCYLGYAVHPQAQIDLKRECCYCIHFVIIIKNLPGCTLYTNVKRYVLGYSKCQLLDCYIIQKCKLCYHPVI